MNSLSRTPLRVRQPVRLRMAQVARIEQLSPLMRRIIFTGDDLHDFSSAAADDHVKLFFPQPGQDMPVLPDVDTGGRPMHTSSSSVIMRDYTPRFFNPETNELAIEFVLHGDGPAATWAAQAKPGQTLGIGGPRGSFIVSENYAHYLLIGDQTALPAIARRLEEMPESTSVTAMIEVADAEEERPLASRADARILWFPRNGVEAGKSTVLQEALQDHDLPSDDLHIWIGAEIDTVRQLRTLLIEDKGVTRDHIRSAGYWRLGAADGGGRVED
ncbi:siderophore-interacting protein [Acetobacter sp.]|uniref:siderophore-interacting protein n=1 Tax=Acetobacter sp. TaxID=440 RepID=UPI0025C16223|nr:siderophore-interacting protein [Acetobacter sp.]MCH4092558.1 siderophore-interacting protein [Acetobacter sp.]MCI1299692.1 siderophore-interacting protein [Acetobacter sp.]MCI1315428.1 siderophore-interacting protein [Acetobacter sp.]